MSMRNSHIGPKLAGLLLIGSLMWGALVSTAPAGSTTELSNTIQYLLDFVRNSGCRFYRNDKAHTASEAAAHMQRKYEHFKDEIKTPEDFIRLSATRSLISGKLYYVELENGKRITSEAWLRQALENYRPQQD